MKARSYMFLSVALAFHLLWGTAARSGSSNTRSGSTIPRSYGSQNRRPMVRGDDGDGREENSSPRLAWNPSPYIDSEGFLAGDYHRTAGEWEVEACIGGRYSPSSPCYQELFDVPVTIRQVPGDGNCLFHAIAATLAVAVNRTHVSMDMEDCGLQDLQELSSELRRRAVACLRSKPERGLFLQGTESMQAGELLDAAAFPYGLSAEKYCELMEQDAYWGGGPEIVALCNALKRPIHVYELCVPSTTETSSKNKNDNDDDTLLHPWQQFRLRRMACFGSPKYDGAEPLHILSADSRFPDVTAGEHMERGSHFLAIFPHNIERLVQRKEARQATRRNAAGLSRGGGTAASSKGSFFAGVRQSQPRDDDRVGKRVGSVVSESNVEGRNKKEKANEKRCGPLALWFSRVSRWLSQL